LAAAAPGKTRPARGKSYQDQGISNQLRFEEHDGVWPTRAPRQAWPSPSGTGARGRARLAAREEARKVREAGLDRRERGGRQAAGRQQRGQAQQQAQQVLAAEQAAGRQPARQRLRARP